MSYAGTYGADETCRHDRYWRSCADCSEVGPKATAQQVMAARQRRLAAYKQAEEERRRKADQPPIGFVRRPNSRKLWCRTCGAGGYDGGAWMDTCRFGHAPCTRCGVITTLLSSGKPRTHGTCPSMRSAAGMGWETRA